MRKSVCAGFLWIISLFAYVHVEQCAATEMQVPHVHEEHFLVSSQDLYFYDDEMMVLVGKSVFPVQALEKFGNQWKVRVTSSGYCQQGHNLCRECTLCHKPGCMYYIKPCRLWN